MPVSAPAFYRPARQINPARLLGLSCLALAFAVMAACAAVPALNLDEGPGAQPALAALAWGFLLAVPLLLLLPQTLLRAQQPRWALRSGAGLALGWAGTLAYLAGLYL